MGKMVKLNLGCGNRKIYGFTNVDINPNVRPDIVDDIVHLYQFKAKTIDLIYVSHTFEHLDYNECVLAANRWYEVLKDGGILRLAVPDLDKICAHFLLHHNLKVARSFLWGGQKNQYDYHKSGWTFDTLGGLLRTKGFKKVCKYNWNETEHSYVDDYSQAYLPHMDKVNGILMSLNIEATK